MSHLANRNSSEIWYTSLLYADLYRLRACLAATLSGDRLSELPAAMTIAELGNHLGGLHAWCQDMLAIAKLQIVPLGLNSPSELDSLKVGDLRSFQFAVRTLRVGYWRIADNREGEIYRKEKSVLLRMKIDPQWITGDHGYQKLRSGNTQMCGIFTVTTLDKNANQIIGIPLLLGEPAHDFVRTVWPAHAHLMCRH